MDTSRIYQEDWSRDQRLRELFDVTRSELIDVVREVVGARADAVENDPNFTPGMFAYIHGVRNTRGLFRPKGWNNNRKRNVELVTHPERQLSIAYQSVDLAAVEGRTPQAISEKGTGSKRVVDDHQLSLFGTSGLDQIDQSPPPSMSGLWHLCVSINGNDIRAEISLFDGIENGNFKRCIERIFLLVEGEWDNLSDSDFDNEDATEFKPVIRRRG